MGFDFSGEVAKRGGQFKPFSHKAFLDQKPGMMERGHCFGLTLIWLSRYVRDRSAGADKLSNLSFTQASKDPQAIQVIHQIQNMVKSSFMTQELINAKGGTGQDKYDQVFGDMNDTAVNNILRGLGCGHVHFYGAAISERDITSRVIDAMERMDSLFLVGTMNHAMGMVVDHRRDLYKFLDVNKGQAVWKGAGSDAPMAGPRRFDSFRDFLRAYLGDPQTRQAYSGGGPHGVLGYLEAAIPH